MANKDLAIYCGCMERVRQHMSVVETVRAGRIDTRHRDLNQELVFLHLRKALEEIAFSSLAANREKYSAVRAEFAKDWNAKRLLKGIAKVNPQFWPIPVTGPQEIAPGRKHFDRVKDGFLTQEELAELYDDASAMELHLPNPYAPADRPAAREYSVEGWSARIKALLRLHAVKLVDVHGLWVVRVYNGGPVEAITAMTDGDFVVEPPS